MSTFVLLNICIKTKMVIESYKIVFQIMFFVYLKSLTVRENKKKKKKKPCILLDETT